MRKVYTLALIAFLLNSAVAFGQTTGGRSEPQFTTDLDAFVRDIMTKLPDIPGVGVVVVQGDRVLLARGYGMADREAGTKADADTMFYIASSTKSFTGLAAALLDREGKIKLDDPVSKYTSGLSMKQSIPDKVTIRDLLIHTSGLRNSALGFRMAYSGQSDPKDMARVFADGTSFNDGAYGKYSYTNLGYNIYAVLLQDHLNKRWQDLLQERIFDPLKMKHTTAYISRAKSKKWSVAAPYIIDPITGRSTRSPLPKTDSNMQSAGGMFTSASDIGRWLLMNMNDGRLDGKQVIPAEIIRAVHKGYTTTTRDAPPFSGNGEYGLGWQIGKYKDEKVIYHHGGFPGYRAHVSFLPDRKVGVAVLVNDGAAGGMAADLIATYAYDSLLTGANVDGEYAKRLEDLSTSFENGKKRFMDGFAERAKRPWQLTKPSAEYAGIYENDLFGTMKVASGGKDLIVSLGNMKCTATAFTEKETIRVELVPGTGEVIKFGLGADDKVKSLTYQGAVFKRKS
ncbi:MAG: serine hydrolase domain-containing protein [Pyrinomonadaceae bacterium]